MPIFEENINFKLPGLGSAEKDTPGSFREGTPFNKISGPSPEPEVSRELVDLKTQEEAVKQTSKTADAMEAMGKMARIEDMKAKQQFIDQLNLTRDNTTSDEEKQQQFIDRIQGPLPKGLPKQKGIDRTEPIPSKKSPPEEESLIGNLISGVKKYGPTIANYIGTGGAGVILGKKIRDRFKGE